MDRTTPIGGSLTGSGTRANPASAQVEDAAQAAHRTTDKIAGRHSTRQRGKPAERQSTRRRKSPASAADRQWSIVVKGTTMGRIDTFRASGEAERADPSDETVINRAPYDAHQAVRSGAVNPTAPADGPGAQIAEEIKRRQISLAVRYLTTLHAR
jgi:hypothetical protein